jgi:hypothetical protein
VAATFALAGALWLVCAADASGGSGPFLELKNRPKAATGSSSPAPADPSGRIAPATPAAPLVPDPAGRSGPGTVIVPVPAAPQSPVPPSVQVPRVTAPQVVIVPDAAQPVEPAKPDAPVTPEETVVTPSVPVAPRMEPERLTPGSFLPVTPEPERREPQKKEPDKTAEPAKKEPPTKELARAEKKETPQEPRKGDPLRIPEQAKQSGNLDFLEGCWVGTRPEYHTKRIVTERFCFDDKGTGKRFIIDPGVAGQCVGATRALLNQGGVLTMQSDKMYCTNTGENWGASDMTCRGEGEHTPCTWEFRDISGTPRQSYSIRFVRE